MCQYQQSDTDWLYWLSIIKTLIIPVMKWMKHISYRIRMSQHTNTYTSGHLQTITGHRPLIRHRRCVIPPGRCILKKSHRQTHRQTYFIGPCWTATFAVKNYYSVFNCVLMKIRLYNRQQPDSGHHWWYWWRCRWKCCVCCNGNRLCLWTPGLAGGSPALDSCKIPSRLLKLHFRGKQGNHG